MKVAKGMKTRRGKALKQKERLCEAIELFVNISLTSLTNPVFNSNPFFFVFVNDTAWKHLNQDNAITKTTFHTWENS